MQSTSLQDGVMMSSPSHSRNLAYLSRYISSPQSPDAASGWDQAFSICSEVGLDQNVVFAKVDDKKDSFLPKEEQTSYVPPSAPKSSKGVHNLRQRHIRPKSDAGNIVSAIKVVESTDDANTGMGFVTSSSDKGGVRNVSSPTSRKKNDESSSLNKKTAITTMEGLKNIYQVGTGHSSPRARSSSPTTRPVSRQSPGSLSGIGDDINHNRKGNKHTGVDKVALETSGNDNHKTSNAVSWSRKFGRAGRAFQAKVRSIDMKRELNVAMYHKSLENLFDLIDAIVRNICTEFIKNLGGAMIFVDQHKLDLTQYQMRKQRRDEYLVSFYHVMKIIERLESPPEGEKEGGGGDAIPATQPSSRPPTAASTTNLSFPDRQRHHQEANAVLVSSNGQTQQSGVPGLTWTGSSFAKCLEIVSNVPNCRPLHELSTALMWLLSYNDESEVVKECQDVRISGNQSNILAVLDGFSAYIEETRDWLSEVTHERSQRANFLSKPSYKSVDSDVGAKIRNWETPAMRHVSWPYLLHELLDAQSMHRHDNEGGDNKVKMVELSYMRDGMYTYPPKVRLATKAANAAKEDPLMELKPPMLEDYCVDLQVVSSIMKSKDVERNKDSKSRHPRKSVDGKVKVSSAGSSAVAVHRPTTTGMTTRKFDSAFALSTRVHSGMNSFVSARGEEVMTDATVSNLVYSHCLSMGLDLAGLDLQEVHNNISNHDGDVSLENLLRDPHTASRITNQLLKLKMRYKPPFLDRYKKSSEEGKHGASGVKTSRHSMGEDAPNVIISTRGSVPVVVNEQDKKTEQSPLSADNAHGKPQSVAGQQARTKEGSASIPIPDADREAIMNGLLEETLFQRFAPKLSREQESLMITCLLGDVARAVVLHIHKLVQMAFTGTLVTRELILQVLGKPHFDRLDKQFVVRLMKWLQANRRCTESTNFRVEDVTILDEALQRIFAYWPQMSIQLRATVDPRLTNDVLATCIMDLSWMDKLKSEKLFRDPALFECNSSQI